MSYHRTTPERAAKQDEQARRTLPTKSGILHALSLLAQAAGDAETDEWRDTMVDAAAVGRKEYDAMRAENERLREALTAVQKARDDAVNSIWDMNHNANAFVREIEAALSKA